MAHDTIVILDYGSQYTQLIARRIREANVYCEILPWRTPAERVQKLNPKGYILGGGPNSVYDEGAPTLPSYVLQSGMPILGICYGMQLLAHNLGGRVASSTEREYGRAVIEFDQIDHPLFSRRFTGAGSVSSLDEPWGQGRGITSRICADRSYDQCAVCGDGR